MSVNAKSFLGVWLKVRGLVERLITRFPANESCTLTILDESSTSQGPVEKPLDKSTHMYMRGEKRRILSASDLFDPAHFEKSVQLTDAGGMTHLAQGLGFDLANSLARDAELLSNFLERSSVTIAESEA